MPKTLMKFQWGFPNGGGIFLLSVAATSRSSQSLSPLFDRRPSPVYHTERPPLFITRDLHCGRAQPQRNYSEWRLLYFISFLLLVGFFVLNMFVGVVVENFHKCRETQEREEKARRAVKHSKKLDRKRRSAYPWP